MVVCKYSDKKSKCIKPVNDPHDNEYCIFHAPIDKKGISGGEFNGLITKQIKMKDYNFRAYIFPEPIDFSKILVIKEFENDVNFSLSIFEGKSGDFCTSFGGVIFKKRALFFGAQFSGNANFMEAQFNGLADFGEAQFNGDTNFWRAQFNRDANFRNFVIKNTMTFIDTQFSENTRFVLESPHFLPEENQSEELSPKIMFERIKFTPQLTYFENIQVDSYNIRSHLPFGLILFRYCNLTDVYFTKCNLSMISFYKNQFDGARFYSNSWDEKKERLIDYIPKIKYRRKNIICDELLFEYVRSLEKDDDRIYFREKYGIKDLDSYMEIASLYCSFKNALDTIKNYSESGWFYFNEFEMKRRALWDEFKDKGKKWNGKLRELGYFILYSLYKIFMGYGEKPSWSILWFIRCLIAFSLINLFGGLKLDDGGIINYDLPLKIPDFSSLFQNSASFFKDLFGTSMAFSISRILPVNLIPKQWQGISYDGWGIVPFANTLILILFIIFIGIGIKRHFRRF